jgi:hypothetical protein
MLLPPAAVLNTTNDPMIHSHLVTQQISQQIEITNIKASLKFMPSCSRQARIIAVGFGFVGAGGGIFEVLRHGGLSFKLGEKLQVLVLLMVFLVYSIYHEISNY